MMHATDTQSLEGLAKAVATIERPEWVEHIEVTEEPDADGEPAVWIWMVVGPDMPAQNEAQPVLSTLREQIRQILAEHAPGLWAYIRIRENEEGT